MAAGGGAGNDEEYLRSLAAVDGPLDAKLEDDLRAIRARTVELQEDELGVPTAKLLAWAADARDAAAEEAAGLAELREELERGAAYFAGRPGEEAVVAALRRHVAWVDACVADAHAIVAFKGYVDDLDREVQRLRRLLHELGALAP